MRSFKVQEKEITVWPAAASGSPVIYLNTFDREKDGVYRELQKRNLPDFTLACICNLNWDHDMTPWYCPPINKMDTPCTGGADDFLKVLTEEIVPKTEKELDGEPAWRGIAGYSLAGLFAVYAVYRTDLFSRTASMSGSLWFPDLIDYMTSHEMAVCPDAAYFSLGDRESKTKNKYLKTTQDNTDQIQKYFAGRGIDSVFVLNPGNHYVNAEKRTADGIEWILRK